MIFALAALALQAATLVVSSPTDWRDAVVGDVSRHEDMRLRVRDETGAHFLSARGDFDGDDREDVVRYRVNESERLYALVLTDAEGDHFLFADNLRDLPRMGLTRAAPGRFTSHWEDRPLQLTRDAFIVVLFEAHSEIRYRCDPGFYCAYVTSD